MKYALTLLSFCFLATACGPNQQILRSAETPTPPAVSPTPLSALEQEVKAMRTADFNFIYVLRRKDAAPLDAADKKIASDNIPPEVNQRKVFDDGRAIIIGSNYRLPGENWKALGERFAIEDFSKPESEIMGANTNANSNTSR